MGAFETLVERLSEERLTGLVSEDMGVHNLDEVFVVLRKIREEFEAADALELSDFPTSIQQNILRSFPDNLESLLAEMGQYGSQTPNPSDARKRYQQLAENLRDIVLREIRPFLRSDDAKIQLRQAESQRLIAEMKVLKSEVEAQQSALAQSSGETAASDLSEFYETQATKHSGSARTFFIAGGVLGALLAGLTWWFLFLSPPDYTADRSSEQWIKFVSGTVGRVALLSIAAFALAFCVRNYRVNMHLEVLNTRRKNALNTFGLLQAAVTTDDARNLVVSELVRSIFTSDETGFLTGEAERTIIEAPGGAGILSAFTRSAG